MTAPDARAGPSSMGRFVLSLAVVVALLAGGRWLVTPDYEQRHYEYFPNMATSVAAESQSLSATLPGGLSQLAPVPGVVIRGQVPFRYGKDDEEAKRAGRELTNPFKADDTAALERGAEVYRIHCVPCHDGTGGGRGRAVERGMLPPPILQAVNAVQMPDGRMFHLLTLGRGNMPPVRSRLDRDDRWRVILHVRKLQAEAA
jgi:mono/diheme cytochrome c family protein